MITSPSPTQQPPEQSDEQKKIVRNTLARRRAGQTPVALFVKAIFRPIFKGIYYFLTFFRSHKLVSLLAIVLILGSATAVNYYETGYGPFGIGYDQFNFQVHGANVGGDQVRDWLYALREGDTTSLSILDRFLSQPPDPQSLVTTYSQTKANLTWKSIDVLGYRGESDTTVDSYVEVDLSTNGPGGSVNAYAFFHFVTATLQSGPGIIGINVESIRASQT